MLAERLNENEVELLRAQIYLDKFREHVLFWIGDKVEFVVEKVAQIYPVQMVVVGVRLLDNGHLICILGVVQFTRRRVDRVGALCEDVE